jgi:hypothetical protein
MCYNAPMKLILALPLILLFAGWQQPVPTYSIHITGEKGSSVSISGCDEQPDGTITTIKRMGMILPVHFYINADHHLRLKIESESSIEAQVFYEYRDVKEWLATAKGTKDVPITFDIPAR